MNVNKPEIINNTLYYRNVKVDISDNEDIKNIIRKIEHTFKTLYDAIKTTFITNKDDETSEILINKNIHFQLTENENNIVVAFVNHHDEIIYNIYLEVIYKKDKFGYCRCKNYEAKEKVMLKQFDRVSIIYLIDKIIKEIKPYSEQINELVINN